MLQENWESVATNWPWIIIALLATRLVSNYFKKGLYKIPGPVHRGISSIPRVLSVYNNKSHEDDLALHQRYGKIVRLAPNLLSITDVSEISQIYGIGTKFIKSEFYSLSTAFDEEGLIPDTFVLTDNVRDKGHSNRCPLGLPL